MKEILIQIFEAIEWLVFNWYLVLGLLLVLAILWKIYAKITRLGRKLIEQRMPLVRERLRERRKKRKR